MASDIRSAAVVVCSEKHLPVREGEHCAAMVTTARSQTLIRGDWLPVGSRLESHYNKDRAYTMPESTLVFQISISLSRAVLISSTVDLSSLLSIEPCFAHSLTHHPHRAPFMRRTRRGVCVFSAVCVWNAALIIASMRRGA